MSEKLNKPKFPEEAFNSYKFFCEHKAEISAIRKSSDFNYIECFDFEEQFQKQLDLEKARSKVHFILNDLIEFGKYVFCSIFMELINDYEIKIIDFYYNSYEEGLDESNYEFYLYVRNKNEQVGIFSIDIEDFIVYVGLVVEKDKHQFVLDNTTDNNFFDIQDENNPGCSKSISFRTSDPFKKSDFKNIKQEDIENYIRNCQTAAEILVRAFAEKEAH